MTMATAKNRPTKNVRGVKAKVKKTAQNGIGPEKAADKYKADKKRHLTVAGPTKETAKSSGATTMRDRPDKARDSQQIGSHRGRPKASAGVMHMAACSGKKPASIRPS
jgi:hypothetical protein